MPLLFALLLSAIQTLNLNVKYIQTDPALTEKGIKQAKSTAAHPLLSLEEADLIVSSPLKRTVQTTLLMLAEAGKSKSVVLHPDIQETGDVQCDTGQPHTVVIE